MATPYWTKKREKKKKRYSGHAILDKKERKSAIVATPSWTKKREIKKKRYSGHAILDKKKERKRKSAIVATPSWTKQKRKRKEKKKIIYISKYFCCDVGNFWKNVVQKIF